MAAHASPLEGVLRTAVLSQESWVDFCKATKAKHGYEFDSVISNVRPWLCVGGRPGSALPANAVLEHRYEGQPVTHVINCLKREEEDALVAHFQSRILTLGLEDDNDDGKMRDMLPKAAEFVRKAREAMPDAHFYVHCMSGVNRAPSVSAAILCAEERCSLLEALLAIRTIRPSIRPKYVKEVAIYEEQVLGKASSVPALRDGLSSGELAASYYGLKDDHSSSSSSSRSSSKLPPAAPPKKREGVAQPKARKRARKSSPTVCDSAPEGDDGEWNGAGVAAEERGGDDDNGDGDDASGDDIGDRERYLELHAQLSHRARTQKEIESSKPDEPSYILEKTLPSFFDSYPRTRRAAERLASTSDPLGVVDYAGARAVLEAGLHVLKTGELRPMDELVSDVLGAPDAGRGVDSSSPIDLTALEHDKSGGDVGSSGADDAAAAGEQAGRGEGQSGTDGAGSDGGGHDDRVYRWQVDGGDAGWLDFEDHANEVVETAYRSNESNVQFVGYQGMSYLCDFSFMIQRNLTSGYVRPVRRFLAS